jgi:hypothetical protein
MAKYYVIEKKCDEARKKSDACGGANNWLVSDEEDDLAAANAFMVKREIFIKKYYKTEKRTIKVISRAERKQMEVKGEKFFRIYSPSSLALGRKTMTEILEK